MIVDIAVTTTEPALRPAARQLAAQLGLALLGPANQQVQLLLQLTPQHLELRQTGHQAPGPVFVDFASAKLNYRRQYGGGGRQSLAKAVGIKVGHRPTLLDATAGLGQDAFVLAALGCRVQLIERSPLIHALLADGLNRALADPAIAELVRERMQLIAGDAITFLEQSSGPVAEVIYLDPMFPERSKSSLVKKELRLLRQIAGDDPDADQLLALALSCSAKRVVVKRPRPAPFLADKPPSFSLSGKSNRFDIYLINRQP